MFRPILLVGVLAATFILALVSCDATAEPSTAPPAALTEPPTATLTPTPEYLTETIPPCIPPTGSTVDPCGTWDVTGSDGDTEDDTPTPEWPPADISEYLDGRVHWAPHLVLRGTFLPNTVRCDAGYTYGYPAHREDPNRAYDTGWTLDDNPVLHCFQDVRVNEYIVGSGPSVLPVEVSYDLYFPFTQSTEALDASENLWERIMVEGGHTVPRDVWTPLLDGVARDIVHWPTFTGIEAMLFVGPSPNVNLEAWAVMALWNIERKDGGSVVVVHPDREHFTLEGNESVLELTIPDFKSKIVSAQAARVAANGGRIRPGPEYPKLLTDANNLRQFLVEVGSYDDPDNPPDKPPAAYECDSTTAVTSPSRNRGLVQDCESLLDSKDTLRGTGSLNWSASTAVTGWDGVTVTDNRIAELELDNENLTGTIPPAIGNLPALTHLDLSGNSLTGSIPRELVNLDSLQVLRLSGNSLTGCIPEGLKDVATNDLNSLNLLDCPPAPSNPSVGTFGEASVPVMWSAVPNATKYRVEYRLGGAGEWALDYRDDWTVAAEVPTGTSNTVTGLICQNDYRVRVRAYGDGTNTAAEWGTPSESVSGRTGTCVSPSFSAASYSFSVRDSILVGTDVGTVAATGSLGADDAVTYGVTAGNEDGKVDSLVTRPV